MMFVTSVMRSSRSFAADMALESSVISKSSASSIRASPRDLRMRFFAMSTSSGLSASVILVGLFLPRAAFTSSAMSFLSCVVVSFMWVFVFLPPRDRLYVLWRMEEFWNLSPPGWVRGFRGCTCWRGRGRGWWLMM